ncbi:MAG: hypothetical protein P4L53_20740 [Candidatus Obscuribacterales bacterium]|nr:hypothetical protein [Candidatus Obscuribacterales bacterium]
MLGSPLPALAQSADEPRDALIRRLVSKAEVPPEVRAYYFLLLANHYLKASDNTSAEFIIQPLANPKYTSDLFIRPNDDRGRDRMISSLNNIARDTHNVTANVAPSSVSRNDGNDALANEAMKSALSEINKSSDQHATLILHFIVYQLYQQMGNKTETKTYSSLLEQDIRACEAAPEANEKLITAASMALNAMAYGWIPFNPSNLPELRIQMSRKLMAPQLSTSPQSVPAIKNFTFTEKEFQQSEKLKLRAAVLADRLPAKNNLRRMNHRDLAIWYAELGKTELADKQKQALFELVGVKDERILYPQPGACGSFVWWTIKPPQFGGGCGMG